MAQLSNLIFGSEDSRILTCLGATLERGVVGEERLQGRHFGINKQQNCEKLSCHFRPCSAVPCGKRIRHPVHHRPCRTKGPFSSNRAGTGGADPLNGPHFGPLPSGSRTPLLAFHLTARPPCSKTSAFDHHEEVADACSMRGFTPLAGSAPWRKRRAGDAFRH